MCEVFVLENGCPDHYEPAGEHCIRASALTATYSDASEKCVAEGGSLLYIISDAMNVRPKATAAQKSFLFENPAVLELE